MADQLIALVGTNVEEKRFERGDVIDAPLDDRQRKLLLREGYAFEVPAKLTPKKREAKIAERLEAKEE